MKGGYDKMAEDNFDDFDSNVEFADDTEQEMVAPPMKGAIQQPQQQPQRARPRPPQKRPQQPVSPQMAVASAEPMQQAPMPPQQQAIQQAAPAQESQARFIPYEMPKRIGLLDRVTGKPVIEDESMMRVIMAQLADIKNDLEEIKSYYS